MELKAGIVVLLLSVLVVLLAGQGPGQSRSSDLPEGFEQILPRGRIAAVFEPRYVSAEQAKIRPEAWVLGVVIDGQARAFSLTLLNSHEVVNDKIGDTAFAAVW